MKILAIVVTYHPEKELLEKNISAFIDDVDKVLIWENTPESEKLNYRFIHHEKVEYCGDGINSISRALNYAWQYAKNNGFDYLLTMDQDSCYENFISLKDYVFKHQNERMILGPCLNRNRNDKLVENEIPDVAKVETLITSGTLLPIKVLDEIGGYDEKLVVDGIDTDISYKAGLLGIPLCRLENANLIQRFGEPVLKHFLGNEYRVSSYSANRLRSILKAHVYLMRKHSNMSRNIKNYIIRHYIMDKTRDIILFEDDKIKKVLSLYRGIIEGLFVKV